MRNAKYCGNNDIKIIGETALNVKIKNTTKLCTYPVLNNYLSVTPVWKLFK